MTIEDRIRRLEKIALVLKPCIPPSRYAREYGLETCDVKEVYQLLSEIKTEISPEPKNKIEKGESNNGF